MTTVTAEQVEALRQVWLDAARSLRVSDTGQRDETAAFKAWDEYFAALWEYTELWPLVR
jgi:hypothetical protein